MLVIFGKGQKLNEETDTMVDDDGGTVYDSVFGWYGCYVDDP